MNDYSQNSSESFQLPDLQDFVKLTGMHFSQLVNIAENGCTRGKPCYTVKKNIGNIKNVIPNNSETVISISTNTYGLQKIAVNICL